MKPKKPNILVLMTDQQRFDAMSCSGNPEIRTPHLDQLAASGVRFSQVVTPTPVCVAARRSFITGHRVSRTHWVSNRNLPGPLPELPTMMSLLLNSGYWTQGIGKISNKFTKGIDNRMRIQQFVEFGRIIGGSGL